MKNVVVIGGGHGQSTILRGLKELSDCTISAIVTVADDGGSTGRIRNYYAIPAMGDVRNLLLALADGNPLLKELMDFRFAGSFEQDIVGHNLGNLILTALSEMSSFEEAIATLSEVLAIRGVILPSSLEVLSLYALMDDDTIVKGENNIPSFNHHITRVFYDHEVVANPKAVKAIEEADLIIYGIGSLYTSILPNLIIPAIREALKKARGKKVYFANCMTQNNETYDYTLNDHLLAFKEHDIPLDLVVKHNNPIPDKIKEKYAAQNSIEVIENASCPLPICRADLLDLQADLVRHDPQKIARVVKELLEVN